MGKYTFFLCALFFVIAAACGTSDPNSKGRSGLAATESSLLANQQSVSAPITSIGASLISTTETARTSELSTSTAQTVAPITTPAPTAAKENEQTTTIRIRDGVVVQEEISFESKPAPVSCASYSNYNGSDLNYVEKLFWDCLLRPEVMYDDDGWVQKLKSGSSRQEVRRDIYNSPEAKCLRGLADCGDMKLTGRFPQFTCNFTQIDVAHPRMKERLLSICPDVSVQVR